MRVLWLVRRNLTEHPGGDTVQIQKTAAALRTRGHEITLACATPAETARFDLAHLFHLDRLWENLAHARRLRAARLPAVLSTIYWPADEFDRGGRAGLQGWLARRVGSRTYRSLRLVQRELLAAREERRWPALHPSRFRFQARVRELCALCAALLPNSAAETAVLRAEFGVTTPCCVVPNAADAELFGGAAAAAPRTGVLCVGRIEPRKNQLALITALRGSGVPLTLVGTAGRYSSAYERRCRAVAGTQVTFVGARPAESLPALYRAALVHACVSWYETPGLASLEAGLSGCALVLTPGGCTREYFGEDAVYARPDDPASIRAAVAEALRRGPVPALATRIAREYTWSAAARHTEEAYRTAVATSAVGPTTAPALNSSAASQTR